MIDRHSTTAVQAPPQVAFSLGFAFCDDFTDGAKSLLKSTDYC